MTTVDPAPADHTPVDDAPTAVHSCRRLFGPNWFSGAPGVVLELTVADATTRLAVDRWPYEARALADAIGWPRAEYVARHVGDDAALCFCTAPRDGLMTATELAEAAWARVAFAAAADESGGEPPPEPVGTPEDRDALLDRLRAAYDAERLEWAAALRLANAAQARGISARLGDEDITLGSGARSRRYPRATLPEVADVPWAACGDVPTVLVTGSNGKTTTTRLIAAMFAEAGRAVGWSSSDGAFVRTAEGRVALELGDMTGPDGARQVLADARVEAAVLETARGGLLRRGLVVEHAAVAVLTNISLDHLGDYGVRSLDDLADVKAVVAHALGASGRLLLNADDPILRRVVTEQRLPARVPVVWFSLDARNSLVQQGVEQYGDGAVVLDGHLLVAVEGAWHDVGAVATMPLTRGGQALHNVANATAGAAAAMLAGVPLRAVHGVLQTFGQSASDNAGRFEVRDLGGVRVVVDYAHNPDGLRALTQAIAGYPATRRLLVLGQAGDRDDAQLAALAHAAVAHVSFDRIILKELPEALRGRALGDVPAVLRRALLDAGVPVAAVADAPSELAAVRDALTWARAGDLLLLPTHVSKPEVAALLDALAAHGWTAGTPLPA